MNRKPYCCFIFLLIPVGIFFLPLILNDQTFAYRDSGRFYFRQFQWNQSQWQKGQIPLWNPQENLGTAVVADGSSSVFYPAQILFLVPGIKYSIAFTLYGAIHVYLASVGAFLLAREIGCDRRVSVFVAVSYSLCGSVIFQTCNLVFLVGAGWLPWGVMFALKTTQRANWWSISGLSFSLALPVLGGDPQAAYHIGIIALLIMGTKWWGRSNDQQTSFALGKSFIGLGAAVTLAVAIAAIQVLPSWEQSNRSTRSYFDNPRTIYEAAHGSFSKSASGIFGHPVAGTHHDHLYQFSQAPWSMIELLWPNISGKLAPTHQRWSDYIPAGGRVWTPSIYCGLVPLLFFAAAWFRKSGPKWTPKWLKLTFLIFALGSFGWFGFGWIWHELVHAFGMDATKQVVGAPVGGVYWFFATVLPGYVNFRYPAKLFVVASLFLCLIGGRELQTRLQQNQLDQFRGYLTGIFCITATLFVTLWFSSSLINDLFREFGPMSEFGPFDSKRAWAGIVMSLGQTAIFSIVLLFILNQGFSPIFLLNGIILITVIDISMANQPLVLTAHSSEWNRSPVVANHLNAITPKRPVRVYRTDPMTWSARSDWLNERSGSRVSQIVLWENETLIPKHHLPTGLQMVESFRSIEPLDYALLMGFSKGLRGISTNDSANVQLAPNPIILGMLSCEYLLLPNWGRPNIPKETILDLPTKSNLQVIRNPYWQPRFRIAHQILNVAGQEGVPPAGESLFRGLGDDPTLVLGNPNMALVESTGPPGQVTVGSPGGDKIEVLRESETLVELKIETDGGMLVMADAFDSDWVAERVDGHQNVEQVSMRKINFVLRGVELESGAQTIRFRYRPRQVYRGLLISALGLLSTIGLTVWNLRRKP